MNKSINLLVFISLFIFSCNNHQRDTVFYNIIDFGAVGDGKTINSVFIQEAIDAASENKGGIVVIPPGKFMSGTVFLKDNITLRLEAGAILLGSPEINDYVELTWGHNRDRQPYHLIVADSVRNISIEGKGTIDGNGAAFWTDYEKDSVGNMVTPRWIRPKDKKISPLIEITRSRNVTIRDVTVKTGGGWNLHLHDCDVARVNGINITNNIYSPNSDGIDITGSSDVIISDCYIKTCDDAICLKTTEDSRSCHRVTITNCIIETLCVGLKLGSYESFKDMTDITMSNCVINKSSRAVGLYSQEGGTLKNINITNIVANTNAPLIFNRPIHLMVNKRRPGSKPGTIKNVNITGFTCVTEGRILMTCEEGGVIENITLRDVLLEYPMIEDPGPMVEGSGSGQFPKPDKHPGAMGALAAVVADNIKNLRIENLQVKWPDQETTPLEWRHKERIENGSKRVHHMDYTMAKQAEFSVLWGKNLTGGRLVNPDVNPSTVSMKKYILFSSDIKIDE